MLIYKSLPLMFVKTSSAASRSLKFLNKARCPLALVFHKLTGKEGGDYFAYPKTAGLTQNFRIMHP